MLKLMCGFTAAAILAAVGGCEKREQQSSTEIRIGAVLLLTGNNALWGQNAKKAIDLLIDEANAKGGINGRKVSIIYEDSQGEAKTAVAAFQKLAEIDKVPAVLGDMLTSTTLAMAPLANRAQIPLIGISCSAPAVTDAGPFVYRVWPSDLYEGKVCGEFAYSKGYRKAAILFINNDYGNGLRGAFADAFQKKGGIVAVEEAYMESSKEFRASAAKIAAAAPDCVYIVGYYEDSAFAAKQLREGGFKGPLLGTSSSVHDKFVAIAGSAADGFVAAVVNDFDMAKLSVPQKNFVEAYKSRYGENPDWAATHGGDAVSVILACLRDKATDGPSIKSMIDARRDFDGINTTIHFDDNGDVVNKPIALKKVVNGAFTTLE